MPFTIGVMIAGQRHLLLGFAAFAAELGCAFSFIGAIIGYALESFGWAAVAIISCVALFFSANGLQRQRTLLGGKELIGKTDAVPPHILPASGTRPLNGTADLEASSTAEPQRKRPWIQYVWYAWIGLALAVLTPETAVTQSDLLQGMVKSLARWIPAVDRYARISDFPEVTRFWIAAMWLLMPIATAYYALNPWVSHEAASTLQTMTPKQYVIVFVFVPGSCLLMLTLSFWFYEPVTPFEHSFTGGRAGVIFAAVSTSRFGLGIFGSVLFCIQAIWLGAGLRTICRILYFSFCRPSATRFTGTK